jgi:YegS/Rv2252/BmrU family lipid kinase
MRESGRGFEILPTDGPGHALEIARSLPLDEGDAVVAAGGDGTCNEVVNGLLSRPPSPFGPPLLGIIPIGRGNDFAFTPGIPGDLGGALRVLVDGGERPLDAGFVRGGLFPDGRYFVNGVGIGFDAKVGFMAAKMRIKSGLSYALAALGVLARNEPSPVLRISGDGRETTLPAVLVSVVNGRRMGGIFLMGPAAAIDDGLLDLCVVRHQSRRSRLLGIVLRYTKGTQGECVGVTMERTARVSLLAIEGGMAAHCDGETVCVDGKELEISCVPGALRLIAPGEGR